MSATEEQLLDEESAQTGARPFWSGTITFGLVSIPVSLFPANRPRSSIALKMVTDDGTPLRRRYVCPEEEEELDWDEIVRGYETEKGKFVVLTDEELEAIEPRKSRDIDLRLFVERDELDPMYFQRAYFLTPAAGSNKAYRLLADVMERTGRAGLATFVMRSKEYLIAILAEGGILRAETLRFQDEIRTPDDIGLPKKSKAKPAEVRRFEREITKRAKKVNFSEFLDEQQERLEKLVEKKRKKGEDVVTRKEAPEEDEGAEVIDLLEVLSQSLKSPQTRSRVSSPGSRVRTPPARRRKPTTRQSRSRAPAKKK